MSQIVPSSEVRSEERFFTSAVPFEKLASPEAIRDLRTQLVDALGVSGWQTRPYDSRAQAFLRSEETPFREEPGLLNDCRWRDPGEEPFAVGLRIVVRLRAQQAQELHEVFRRVFTDFFGHRSAPDDREEGLAVYTFGANL